MLPQTNSVASRDAILRVAEAAEELEFDAVTVHDHLVFNGFWIASGMHWPAAVVPMGYTYEDLPSGLQIVGRPWSEPVLIEIAYAFELLTQVRRPPNIKTTIKT